MCAISSESLLSKTYTHPGDVAGALNNDLKDLNNYLHSRYINSSSGERRVLIKYVTAVNDQQVAKATSHFFSAQNHPWNQLVRLFGFLSHDYDESLPNSGPVHTSLSRVFSRLKPFDTKPEHAAITRKSINHFMATFRFPSVGD
jgi:hypothetical protein